ncbi:ethanolamine ammonia-lyase light chain EutC [Rhodococcus sp. USK13]|uniref:ethanolamine ammonia-lyase light chain EutC n=1 Tax=Rhodococcus sp. USK13 TaxID=2806442 RepID=UPI001BCC7BA3|nr:ethanolamine ammonia-lyase light chain EutC [Rhodococcus sp. USK13]
MQVVLADGLSAGAVMRNGPKLLDALNRIWLAESHVAPVIATQARVLRVTTSPQQPERAAS